MKKLHPAMFAVMIVPFIQRFGVLLLVLVFTAQDRGLSYSLWALGIGLFSSVLFGAAHYFTTEYGIVGGKLEFHTGWIWTKHKVVPIERIQSVHIEQNLVHRMFNVAAVRVDTGVTNKMEEVQIIAIDYEEAQRLRQRLLQRLEVPTEGGHAFQAPVAGPALFQLSVGELAMHGFAHNRWIYVVGGLFGLAEFAGGEESFIRSVAQVYDVGPADQVVRIAFSIVGVLTLGWLVSIGFSLTQFYGFTLSRHPKGLSIDRGLFTRKQTVVPLGRVSGIEVQANFLMRWLGMSSVTVQILGSREEEGEGGKTMVSPWVATNRLEEMLQMIMPETSTRPGGWKRLPKRSIGRRLISTLTAYLVMAIILLGIFSTISAISGRPVGSLFTRISSKVPWLGQAILGVIALTMLVSILHTLFLVYTSRARVTEHMVEQQEGWLNRTWKMLPISRMQKADLSSSRLQRLFRLRSIEILAPAMVLSASDLDPADAELILNVAREKRRKIKSRGI